MGNESPEQHVTVTLRLDEQSKQLKAVIAPAEGKTAINEKWLIDAINKNYDDLYLLKPNLKTVLAKVKSAELDSEIPVAEIRDAVSEIEVSEDSMQAFISVTPAYGGEVLRQETVDDLIMRSGITEGLIEENIKMVVSENKEQKQVLIAQGRNAVNGNDASFEDLLPKARATGPVIDKNGKADMYSLNEFLVVDPGTPLMRRFPATPGEDGYNVHGQQISAQAGEDHFFSECEGAMISNNDENLLVSEIKGYPEICHHGVIVNPTLELNNVDLSTGNVDFDGSVHIKGDIGDGLTVKATGDVLVEGVIQKAVVKSGGSIFVKNGIIGGAFQHDEDDTVVHHGVHLEAEHEIHARFIDNAFLQAGKVIEAQEYIRHSHTVAGDQVLLGTTGGRGRLIGGEVSATNLVNVKELGTGAHVPTYVEVGIDPKLRDEYDSLSAQLHDMKNDMNGLVLTFSHLTKKSKSASGDDEKKIRTELVKVATNIKLLKEEINRLVTERSALDKRMEKSKEAKVVVTSGVHPNVVVKVKDRQYKVHEESKGGSFLLKGDRVEFDS